MLLRSLICLKSNVKRISLQQKQFFNYKSGSFLSDRDGVRDFIALLGPKERRMLFDELEQVQKLEVSAAPDNLNISPDVSTTTPPNFSVLKLVFLNQALPFIGFGFLDNLIMILAGDYIDTTIGVTLGISTMAAAGLGNALSDVAGLGSAWYVEQLAAKVGVKRPKMSLVQSEMARTRWTIHLGRAVGVTIGCLLGMVPLLFKKKHSSDK